MYTKVKGNPSLSRILFKAKAKKLLCYRRGSTVSVFSGGRWIVFFRMSPFTACRAISENPRWVYGRPAFYCDDCGGTCRLEQYGGSLGTPLGPQLICKNCKDVRNGKAAARVKVRAAAKAKAKASAKDGPNQAVCSIIGAS